jgi:hypothetical protein
VKADVGARVGFRTAKSFGFFIQAEPFQDSKLDVYPLIEFHAAAPLQGARFGCGAPALLALTSPDQSSSPSRLHPKRLVKAQKPFSNCANCNEDAAPGKLDVIERVRRPSWERLPTRRCIAQNCVPENMDL